MGPTSLILPRLATTLMLRPNPHLLLLPPLLTDQSPLPSMLPPSDGNFTSEVSLICSAKPRMRMTSITVSSLSDMELKSPLERITGSSRTPGVKSGERKATSDSRETWTPRVQESAFFNWPQLNHSSEKFENFEMTKFDTSRKHSI